MIIKLNILDKNFKITRKFVFINKPISRGLAIKILRKHGCTLKKDFTVVSSKGDTLVMTTDGIYMRLAYHPKLGLAFATKS